MTSPGSWQGPAGGGHGSPLVPIALSILGVVAWLVFILLYALFWSKGYDLFQNIVVTIASLLIVGLLIGLMWVVWGLRVGRRWGAAGWAGT